MASTIPVPLLDTQDSRSWWFVLGGKIGCSGFYSQKSQNTLSYFPGKAWAYLGHLEDLGVLFQPDWKVRSTPLDRGGWPGFYVALRKYETVPFLLLQLTFYFTSDPLQVCLSQWFYGPWNPRTRVVHHEDEGPLPPLYSQHSRSSRDL